MVIMDGSNVELGDAVFDTLLGPGTVEQYLGADKVRVKFGAGRGTHTFSGTGIRAGFPARTLFWRNPVIVVPPKSARDWDFLTRIMSGVVEAVQERG